MIIHGSKLNDAQRAQVLAAFGYRLTHENKERALRWYGKNNMPTAPLISDEEWLDTHAFHFIKDGSRMNSRVRWAEPGYMAVGR